MERWRQDNQDSHREIDRQLDRQIYVLLLKNGPDWHVWSHESVLAAVSLCCLIFLWPDFALCSCTPPAPNTYAATVWLSCRNDEHEAIASCPASGKTHNMPLSVRLRLLQRGERKCNNRFHQYEAFLHLSEMCRFAPKVLMRAKLHSIYLESRDFAHWNTELIIFRGNLRSDESSPKITQPPWHLTCLLKNETHERGRRFSCIGGHWWYKCRMRRFWLSRVWQSNEFVILKVNRK